MNSSKAKLCAIGLIFLFTACCFLNIAPRFARAEDSCEPNNSIEFATVLSKECYFGLTLTTGDKDYYCVYLREGENASIAAGNDAQAPNLYITNPRSYEALMLTNGTVAVAFLCSVTQAGYYYFCVSGSAMTYSLNVTDILNPSDDLLEPNNNFASATPLSIGDTHLDLRLWDTDCYKIHFGIGENASIVLNRTGNEPGVVQVALYAPDNTTIIDSIDLSSQYCGSLCIQNASEAGDYILRVRPSYAGWGNYSLAVRYLDDDRFESNNNYTTATLLDKNTLHDNLCLLDDDFYNFTLTAGENVLVTLNRKFSDSAISVSLLDPSQSQLTTSSPIDSNPAYQYLLDAPTSGTYTIKVNGTAAGRGNYSLLIETFSDDAWESVEGPDNDAFATATDLARNTAYNSLVFADTDFYNFTLPAGANFSVTMTHTIPTPSAGYSYSTFDTDTASGTPLSFAIYAPDKSTRLASALLYPGYRNEIAVFNVPAGNYYVRVNASTSIWANYTLVGRDLLDDAFEENDAFAVAQPLAKNSMNPSFALLDGSDLFNVTLSAGDNLSVAITRSGGNGTISACLMAPDQKVLQFVDLKQRSAGEYFISSIAPVAGELTLLSAPVAGNYTIRVSQVSDSFGNYTLAARDINDDRYEDNDVMGAGPLLTKGSYSSLALLDDDFYNLSIAAGDNLSIVLVPENSGSGSRAVSMHLFSPSGALLCSQSPSFFTGSAEIALPPALENGPYFLHVNTTAGPAGNYTLTISDLPDDACEENDAAETATAVSKGSYLPNQALYDDDFYTISLAGGENLSISLARRYYFYTLRHSFTAFLLDAATFSVLQVLNLTGVTSGNMVTFAPPAGRTYLLKVNGTTGPSSNYSIHFDDALDDACEVNDDLAHAWPLVNGTTYTDLFYRGIDFYNVSLLAGGEFAVTLLRGGGDGSFNVSLHSPTGELLSQYTVLGSSSGVVYLADVPSAGPYTICVNGSAGAFGAYTLVLGAITDDPFESNDDFVSATPLTLGAYCPGLLFDPDFFRYEAAPGESFEVLLSFDLYMTSPCNVTIYAPDQVTAVCASAYRYYPMETYPFFMPVDYLDVYNAAGGTYYIKVNATPGQFASYQVSISSFGGTMPEDSSEDNDVLSEATPVWVTMGSIEGRVFDADEDWYAFSLDASSTLCIYWFHMDLLSGIAPALFNASGAPLALSDAPPSPSVTGSFHVQYYSTVEAGNVYLRFRADPGKAGIYLLMAFALNASQPADVTYLEHSTGHAITWALSDSCSYSVFGPPDACSATVYRDSAPVLARHWVVQDSVTINVDGLAPGTYQYTLAVSNWVGILRNDTVTVHVTPVGLTVAPAADVVFVIGNAPVIQWAVDAPCVGDTSYAIQVGDTVLASGSWLPGTVITFTPASLGVGAHMLVLTVADGLGNSTTDEVTVTVSAAPASPPPSPEYFLIGGAIGVVIVAGVLTAYRWKKRTFYPKT